MSEGVEATVMSSEDSAATTTTTATSTSTMTTPLDSPERLKKPSSPTIASPPSSHSHHPKTVRKHRKHVHTSEGTFIWIDGKKIRSALTNKKWPPRPRRVTFPINDVDLVTGYLEPANPWQHAENVNIEDVISSYKISCEQHRTQPLQNVINQLEKLDISDDDRCPEFCLKNELLDYRRCEPLEEIFKRVQFEKLDLEASALDDESAVTLFDMFEYYETAKHLDISNNRDVGARGWQACAHMIKKATCLETLEARDITLTQQHITILKRPLQLVSHLHVLKLENCGLAGRAFAMLVSALKMNTGLKELYLADNGLEQEDAIQLGALLRVNNHLQLLDISNNHIEDEGVRDILDGLIAQSSEERPGKGLGILVLWNNDLTKHSSGHFTQTIAVSNTLETLNIGKNSVSNELLEMAQEALINSRTLVQLGMQSTNITCKGALALADIIERNRSLQRIDLRDNNIQMTGLTALSFAMKKNTSITQMDLDDIPWSKTPATMHQYLDLVAAIRGYCARNEEPTSTEESTEESSSPQHRSRLSSVSSRKISLTCQTLPRSSSSMNSSLNEITTRSMLEPNSTSGGRLRSPAPSPIPSPVASPIPSPSRGRFVVSRVSEASLTSPNISIPSSPVTPPSSLASSPTCFITSADGISSRFRVVTVVESPSEIETIPKTVITLPKSSVNVGFNREIGASDSAKRDGDSANVFESIDEANRRPDRTESNATKADDNANNINVEIDKVAPLPGTGIELQCDTDNAKRSNIEDDRRCSIEAPTTDCATTQASTSNPSEISSAIIEKDLLRPEESSESGNRNVDEKIVETVTTTTDTNDEPSCNDRIYSFPSKTKKSEPSPRQATSLERLLNLFHHPGSLFSGSSLTETTETKNPLQDGVNSVIALGDKFQQYFRESGGGGGSNSGNSIGCGVSGKSGFDNTSSHGFLQRSASDASRSSIKLDPVKFLSVPQLSSVRGTQTQDFLSRKDVSDHVDSKNFEKHHQTQIESIFVMDEAVSDVKTKSDDVSKIIDDPTLTETSGAIVPNVLDEIVASSTIAFDRTISRPKSDLTVEIVNSATLNVDPEIRTAKSAQKLTDIPEYPIAEMTTTNASGIDETTSHSSTKDSASSRTDDDAIIKCDSSTANSINYPSFKISSLRSLTCDISGVKCTNETRITDDVHNFFNSPYRRDDETTIEASDYRAVSSVSSTEADDKFAIIRTETIENFGNNYEIGMENFSSEISSDSNELRSSSDTKKLEDATSNEPKSESSRTASLSVRMQTITTNDSGQSLIASNDSSIIDPIYVEFRNDQNDRLSDEKLDEPTITSANNELLNAIMECSTINVSDTSEKFTEAPQHEAATIINAEANENSFPIYVATVTEPSLKNVADTCVKLSDARQLDAAKMINNEANDNLFPVDETIVTEPSLDNIVSINVADTTLTLSEAREHEAATMINAEANENSFSAYVATVTEPSLDNIVSINVADTPLTSSEARQHEAATMINAEANDNSFPAYVATVTGPSLKNVVSMNVPDTSVKLSDSRQLDATNMINNEANDNSFPVDVTIVTEPSLNNIVSMNVADTPVKFAEALQHETGTMIDAGPNDRLFPADVAIVTEPSLKNVVSMNVPDTPVKFAEARQHETGTMIDAGANDRLFPVDATVVIEPSLDNVVSMNVADTPVKFAEARQHETGTMIDGGANDRSFPADVATVTGPSLKNVVNMNVADTSVKLAEARQLDAAKIINNEANDNPFPVDVTIVTADTPVKLAEGQQLDATTTINNETNDNSFPDDVAIVTESSLDNVVSMNVDDTLVKSYEARQLDAATIINNETNDNSFSDDVATVTELSFNNVVSMNVVDTPANLAEARQFDATTTANNTTNDNLFPAIVTEPSLSNVVSVINDNKDSTTSTNEPTVTSPSDPEISCEDPIAISHRSISSTDAICQTTKEETINIHMDSTNHNDFFQVTTFEQVLNMICEDSDCTSQLSVDDSRTSEISSNASTSVSSVNNAIEQIVTETSIIDDCFESANFNIEDSSFTTKDRRFHVRPAVESVVTASSKVSENAKIVKISTEINRNESTMDVEFDKTDTIITNVSSIENDVTHEISTITRDFDETANLSYLSSAESSRSSTNLHIENSRTRHSNSQDSGIEESTIMSCEEISYDGNNQTRQSFQESVDSGIDSEGSSVCARLEIGADVQKERARDPGKNLMIDEHANDGTIGISSSRESVSIDETSSIGNIGNSLVAIEIGDINNSNQSAFAIGPATNNETGTTD